MMQEEKKNERRNGGQIKVLNRGKQEEKMRKANEREVKRGGGNKGREEKGRERR